MKYVQYLIGLFVLFNVGAVFSAPVCKVTNANDVLDCALKHSPNVVSSTSAISVASINKDISGRFLNPDLEITGGYNKEEDDQKGIVMGLSVMQTIETPTKRKARVNKASAELLAAAAGYTEQKEITAVQVLTILNRLRQIEQEKSVLNETISTFSNIIKKYNGQSALSYEDKVSADLFKLALNNYQIEKNQLAGEEKNYLANLQSILNMPVKMNRKLFFYPPKIWPKIGKNASVDNSIDVALQKADVDRYKAGFLEAKTSSFNSVSVGPYVNTRPGNLGTADEYGVKFTLPIPIYSNKAAVSAGRIAMQNAEMNLEAKKRELAFSFASLREQYGDGVKALRNFGIGNIESKHKQTENLFDTGRVSSSILIEAHRQVWESVRIYHLYELETLQSLWKLYALQGKLLKNVKEVCYVK